MVSPGKYRGLEEFPSIYIKIPVFQAKDVFLSFFCNKDRFNLHTVLKYRWIPMLCAVKRSNRPFWSMFLQRNGTWNMMRMTSNNSQSDIKTIKMIQLLLRCEGISKEAHTFSRFLGWNGVHLSFSYLSNHTFLLFLEVDPLSHRPDDSEEVIKEKVCSIFKQYFIVFLSIRSQSPKLK